MLPGPLPHPLPQLGLALGRRPAVALARLGHLAELGQVGRRSTRPAGARTGCTRLASIRARSDHSNRTVGLAASPPPAPARGRRAACPCPTTIGLQVEAAERALPRVQVGRAPRAGAAARRPVGPARAASSARTSRCEQADGQRGAAGTGADSRPGARAHRPGLPARIRTRAACSRTSSARHRRPWSVELVRQRARPRRSATGPRAPSSTSAAERHRLGPQPATPARPSARNRRAPAAPPPARAAGSSASRLAGQRELGLAPGAAAGRRAVGPRGLASSAAPSVDQARGHQHLGPVLLADRRHDRAQRQRAPDGPRPCRAAPRPGPRAGAGRSRGCARPCAFDGVARPSEQLRRPRSKSRGGRGDRPRCEVDVAPVDVGLAQISRVVEQASIAASNASSASRGPPGAA